MLWSQSTKQMYIRFRLSKHYSAISSLSVRICCTVLLYFLNLRWSSLMPHLHRCLACRFLHSPLNVIFLSSQFGKCLGCNIYFDRCRNSSTFTRNNTFKTRKYLTQIYCAYVSWALHVVRESTTVTEKPPNSSRQWTVALCPDSFLPSDRSGSPATLIEFNRRQKARCSQFNFNVVRRNDEWTQRATTPVVVFGTFRLDKHIHTTFGTANKPRKTSRKF